MESDRTNLAYGAVNESSFLFLIGSDIVIELEASNEGGGKERSVYENGRSDGLRRKILAGWSFRAVLCERRGILITTAQWRL